MDYKKTNWVDSKTVVNAERLNKIENAIAKLAALSLTPGNMKTINGKSIVGSGDLEISSSSGSMTLEELLKLIGYTPAAEENIPVWESYESDGTRTPEEIEGQGSTQGLIGTSDQYIFGRFNVANTNILLSIGSGTSDTDRRNSVEVWKTGDVYIYGVGGFDGTNSSDAGVYPISSDLGTASGGSESGVTPWSGTLAEYQALDEVDPERIYYITKS